MAEFPELKGIQRERCKGFGKMIRVIGSIVAISFLVAILVGVGVLYYQGKRKPTGTPQYVALGSSFAAGFGLGARDPGSALVCMRSSNGYPQQLARSLGLSLVDRSCSGAKASHVLRGGQFFLGPQIDAVGAQTELVTITVGGNDVHYVGDLSFMAGRNGNDFTGWALGQFWSGPLKLERRDFAGL